MKIKSIKLDHFRSAKALHVSFDEKNKLLVGINGAGKSTILDAISLCLTWFVNRLQNDKSNGSLISLNDINIFSDYSSIEIEIVFNSKLYKWSIVRQRNRSIDPLKSELSELKQLILEIQKSNIYPVLSYYTVNRNFKIKSNMQTAVINDIYEIYENSLNKNNNYADFFEWFRKEEDISNEKKLSWTYWLDNNSELIDNYLNNIKSYISKSEANAFDLSISNTIDANMILLNQNIGANYLQQLSQYFLIYNNLLNNIQKFSESFNGTTSQFWEYYIDAIYKLTNSYQDLIICTLSEELKGLIFSGYKLCITLSTFWLDSYEQRIITESIKKINSINQINLYYQNILLEILIGLKKNVNKRKNTTVHIALKFVTKAIENFTSAYSNLRVQRTPESTLLIDKNNITFDIDQLSEGERNLIALIGDIARRLTIANKDLENPLEGKGVIIIDELDLHLHPRWQRELINKLSVIFPNCQFLCSTHSPQIISDLKSNNIISLQSDKNGLYITNPKVTKGLSSNLILESVLDVPAMPYDLKKKLNLINVEISNMQFDKARLLIGELILDYSEQHPEILDLISNINKMEQLFS